MDTSIRNPTPPSRRPGGGWSAGRLVTLINAVLAGVGGVYLVTESVTITIVAAGMAVIVVALVLRAQR
ncbi:hypothetical protein M8C17_01545 [Micromonospora sp. RHAY321]|uniref:hypothetical protein n=1 Tax=Micromonospora sp. RHAY321 TaxID=2944807 RepID=UPI00207CC368|nr:hypothetical protein [Micromonospora sp. RHAY321]MCO1593845.1 hypothetical protein [Micromonospora sp. RHAY321]